MAAVEDVLNVPAARRVVEEGCLNSAQALAGEKSKEKERERHTPEQLRESEMKQVSCATKGRTES